MEQRNIDVLPDTELFRDVIAIRDFSRFDIEDGDTEEQKQVKRAGLAGAEEFMDLYTESLVPCVAGAKLFHPNIRHFEPMTTSKMPLSVTGMEQLRVPASTEAMAILTYDNNKSKWEAMRKWNKEHPNSKIPRWSSKNPDVNKEFKELYSNCEGKTDPWGGWSYTGRTLFNNLQVKILESRRQNFDRHVKYDNECVARLYDKFKEMHREAQPSAKKPRTEPAVDIETDKNLEYIVEI